MKQTVIQQAIEIVRKRIDSMNDTLMGKHTAHHLQQVERELWALLKDEKEQIKDAHLNGQSEWDIKALEDINIKLTEEYYKETYGKK
jgi:hypothetical protein